MIRKSERALTNAEYEELKQAIEKNDKKYDDREVIDLLILLKEFDKSDVYVAELSNRLLQILLVRAKHDLIHEYYNSTEVSNSLLEKNEDISTEEELIKKASDMLAYIHSTQGLDEEDIDYFLSELRSNQSLYWSVYWSILPSMRSIMRDFLISSPKIASEEFLFKYLDYVDFTYLTDKVLFPERVLEKAVDDNLVGIDKILIKQKVSANFLDQYQERILNYECLKKINREDIFCSENFIIDNIDEISNAFYTVEIRPFLNKHNKILSDKAVDKIFDYFEHNAFSYSVLRITKKAEEFLEQHRDYMEKNNSKMWFDISRNNLLSEEFIDKYKDDLDIKEILETKPNLSEDFIENNIEDYGNWSSWFNICQNSKLSEDFMEKHKNNIHWSVVSSHQTLSEDFMLRNKDYLSWFDICQYQKLSIDFILGDAEPYVKKSIKRLKMNKKIDQEKMKQYKVYEILYKLKDRRD